MFTSERNHQILIALLKHHNIKRIVTSPGGTNITFVASVQRDPFFELYSSVDERSAAYMACGMAEESGEPVVLSCTGATAARNYFPGLTEAYYRKLPVLAVTSTMPVARVGHNFAQATDRSIISNDIAKYSTLLPVIKDQEDEWSCTVKCNEALLELSHHGKGPVHINLETTGAPFDANCIKDVKGIDRLYAFDKFPCLTNKRIGIFVGAHSKWSDTLTDAVDSFCRKYNAVVICDHTSNYTGDYGVLASLITYQKLYKPSCTQMDLIIHFGNISGAYIDISANETWRVAEDGRICDTFKKLRYVFEMDEITFFQKYNDKQVETNSTGFYKEWQDEYNRLLLKLKEVPFSNIWVARRMAGKLPVMSELHLGILNSLRSWNFFEIDRSIRVYSNTGGFGIDGCVSSLLGASLVNPEKLYFGVVGDLAFFYDLNSLGNRDFGRNVRLIVINNGRGQEFKNYGSRASQFGREADPYIAATGHFGNQSRDLIKSYAVSLGFQYMMADSMEAIETQIDAFTSPELGERPIVFEIFTETEKETEALKIVCTLEKSINENAKKIAKEVIGDKGVKAIKAILKK